MSKIFPMDYMTDDDREKIELGDKTFSEWFDQNFEEIFKDTFDQLIKDGLAIRTIKLNVETGEYETFYQLTPKAYADRS